VSTQLALDLVPERLVRDGVWPIEEHQRGWTVLPWDCGIGPKGMVMPAWVCCRCGGIELGAYLVDINHGCCMHWQGINGHCTRMSYYPPRHGGLPWLAVKPP
jgi:hypothetical protein